MRWLGWLGALALGWAGCAAPAQDRVRAYNEDAVFLYQRGDYAGARDTFLAALTLQPEDPGLLYNAGQCYDRLGDATKAETYYNQCLQRVPNHPACRHAQVALLVRQGRTAEVTRLIEDWLKREPKSAEALALDGWLWHQAGDLPRAQIRLQQALELDPRNCRALTELALVYEAVQMPDRALVLYERSLEQDRNQPDVAARINFLLSRGAKPPKPE